MGKRELQQHGNDDKVSVSNKRKKNDESGVLISGMNGVGALVAKCLILGGVKHLTLQDDKVVDILDLCSNPYMSDDDVGRNRAEVCLKPLMKLNNDTSITVWPSEIGCGDQLSDFCAVVCTDSSLYRAMDIDYYCHNHRPPIPFIKVDVRGLFGRVFCDFGPLFSTSLVQEREICRHQKRAIVTINQEHPHIIRAYKVRGTDATRRFVQSTTTPEGDCAQCTLASDFSVQTKVLHFKTLRDALNAESVTDLVTGGERSLLLHFVFMALDEFVQQHDCLPSHDSPTDQHLLYSLVLMLMKRVHSFDQNGVLSLIRLFTRGSTALIAPMASIFAGIVANEVLKATSGISQPIVQFFYFDSLASIPAISRGAISARISSRYFAQTLVFGREVQKKLEQAKLLVVGDGVLGCEMITNLALMGLCSGIDGKLVVTHRLPAWNRMYNGRQTIFEDAYELQGIPSIATASALLSNRAINIQALDCLKQDFGPVYDEAFWKRVDVMIDATNDVHSTKNVTAVSKHFLRPLIFPLVSGTECHSLVDVSSTRNLAVEKVLYRFPFIWRLHEEYLGWARSEFEGLFVKTPKIVNGLLLDRDSFLSAVRVSGDSQSQELLYRILECLEAGYCESFDDCISWARTRFQAYFVDDVDLFLKTLEEKYSAKGAEWALIQKAGIIKTPKRQHFSAHNLEHLKFVKAASKLRADTFGIDMPESVDWMKKMEDVQLLPPMQVIKAVAETPMDMLTRRIDELVGKVPLAFQMNPTPFEVDLDDHMDFVTSMFNLFLITESRFKLYEERAKEVLKRCYPLPSASASMVAAGLSCLNIYKLIGGGVEEAKGIENVGMNLKSLG